MPDAQDIVVHFEDRGELERAIEQNLRSGGVLAPRIEGVQRCDLCRAVLVHPDSGEQLVLDASVVMVGEETMGLAFLDFDDAMRKRIEAFADAALPLEGEGSKRRMLSKARGGTTDVQRRVRGLPPIEAQKLAGKGDLAERRALERVYGKLVWDHLLRNPRITKPEVARIARKGTAPRPLIELVVDNAAWIRDPQVRRALLSNPRMTRSMIDKVLRVTPRPELKLVPKQTSYPRAVRELAAKLLG